MARAPSPAREARALPGFTRRGTLSLLMMMKTTAQGVIDKNKVKGAENFLKGRSRAVDPQHAGPEVGENSFRCERRRPWHARVVPTKSAELMCIGSRNQRFVKLLCNVRRAAVRVKKAFVKMTEFNRVEAIDFLQ